MVPALLLVGNKAFGVSSNFRHVCAAIAPCGIEFFKHDWKRAGLWNLVFLAGVFAGASLVAVCGFFAGGLTATFVILPLLR